MPRNVPTLLNVGYRQLIFWDGRAETLEKMALGALEHPAIIDMTAEELTARLRSISEYDELFRQQFGEAQQRTLQLLDRCDGAWFRNHDDVDPLWHLVLASLSAASAKQAAAS